MTNNAGDFLVSIGALSRDQAETILIQQRRGDTRMFSEIAMDLGYLGDNAIKRYVEYLEKQKPCARQGTEAKAARPMDVGRSA